MSLLADLVHWFQAHSILLMLGIFTAMGLLVYAPGTKDMMERNAHIPLEDEG